MHTRLTHRVPYAPNLGNRALGGHGQHRWLGSWITHCIQALAFCLLLPFLVAACGGEAQPDLGSEERTYDAVYVPGGGDTEPGRAHARMVLDADPQRTTLTEAWVREEQLLGIVLRKEISGEVRRDIMLGLAAQMAETFKDRDVEVIAYDEAAHAPVAQAVYSAQSGKTTYETVP